MNNSDLNRKIKSAIKLLQSVGKSNSDIELAYSGGKDSDVILELAKMSGIKFTPIYKNTTIDPPYTITHCKNKGVQIVQPKMTFFELIRKKGFPTRQRRFCCEVLKEYKIKDVVILGIRREESAKRAKNYTEPIMCYRYSKSQRVDRVLPILDWTLDDIREFVIQRNIQLHPLYYNEDGSLNLKRRLGCLGCPLSKNNGKDDFLKYPKFVKLWIKNWRVFDRMGADCYEEFARHISNNPQELRNNGALFQTDYKKQLENYFDITL